MPRHYKVHQLLSRGELDELEAFSLRPGCTIDECVGWMAERGHAVSRTAVGNWRAAFERSRAVSATDANYFKIKCETVKDAAAAIIAAVRDSLPMGTA